MSEDRPIEPITFRRLGRGRPVVVVLLALSIVAIVVVAVLAAVLSPTNPNKRVTLPVADRAASPALREAASSLGFSPTPHDDSTERKPASAAPDPPARLLPIGTLAPDFALQTPVGKTVRLSALRGRPVLLEFFATWCPHCAAEAPHLRSLFSSLRNRVSFVAVNADSEDDASVFAFHAWFGLPFPALVDAGDHAVKWPGHGRVGPVASRYRVGSFPTFYVLDSRGRITWRSAGEQPDAKLRQELARATVSR